MKIHSVGDLSGELDGYLEFFEKPILRSAVEEAEAESPVVIVMLNRTAGR